MAITLTDENERIISWNKYVEHLLGMDKNDLYMKHVSLLYPSKEWQKIRAQNVRQKGMQHHLEIKILRKNNELLDACISLSVLKNNEGRITGSIGVIKDISKRKQIEEKLRRHSEQLEKVVEKRTVGLKKELSKRKNVEKKLKEREETYRLLVESSGAAITLFDIETTCLFMNTIAAKNLNGKPDEFIGKSMYDIYSRDTADRLLERFHSIFKSGEGETIEEEVESLNRWISSNLLPVRNIDGKIIGVQILTEDITNRKKVEEKLQESEEKFRTIYESATDAIMLLDKNGVFDCNAATLRIFGLSSMNRFISKNLYDLSPPTQPDGKNSLAAFNEHIETAYEKESDYFEWMYKCADGTIFPAIVLINHIKLRDRDILQAVIRDVTKQKRIEKEIIKKNMKLKVAHKKLSALNKDLEQKIKERTNEVEKLLLQKDQFIGQLGHDLKNPLNPLVNLIPVL